MTPLPPKQGLKLFLTCTEPATGGSYDTTSTKTRIETTGRNESGLPSPCYDTTSTKTRIETGGERKEKNKKEEL